MWILYRACHHATVNNEMLFEKDVRTLAIFLLTSVESYWDWPAFDWRWHSSWRQGWGCRRIWWQWRKRGSWSHPDGRYDQWGQHYIEPDFLSNQHPPFISWSTQQWMVIDDLLKGWPRLPYSAKATDYSKPRPIMTTFLIHCSKCTKSLLARSLLVDRIKVIFDLLLFFMLLVIANSLHINI